MMTRTIAALLTLAPLACATSEPASQKPTAPVAEREEAPPETPPLRSARPGQTVDFTELRTRYGSRPDYVDRCESDRPLSALLKAADQASWEEVIHISETWLGSCPVDIDAHYLRSLALDRLGREAEGRLHLDWARGLVESVLSSGDGTSVESPYVVISVAEEYSMLRVLGLRHQHQTLVRDEIDAILAQDEDGKRVTIYFWPKAHWRRLEQMFPD